MPIFCLRAESVRISFFEEFFMRKRSRFLAHSAIIAALYAVLCYFQNFIIPNSASWAIQLRAAEALCILAFFTPAAIPGLFVGCLIGNVFGGSILPDIIFGSFATLIGAFFTHLLRKQSKYLAPLPPILANTIIVPLVLRYAYGINLPIPFLMMTIGIGEVISCGVLGMIVYAALEKYKYRIFKDL
mgnify:CR=1 FL=1